jgi:predicted ester cyclase
VSNAPTHQTRKEDQLTELNLRTVERFLAGTHSHDIEDVRVIDETVAATVACHGFPGFPDGELSGREAYKAFFRIFRQSFSEMDFTTLATIARGDFVSAHWHIGATFSGTFAGIEPDLRRVIFDGVALYRLERGLIAETWLSFNMPLLLAQLPRPLHAVA